MDASENHEDADEEDPDPPRPPAPWWDRFRLSRITRRQWRLGTAMAAGLVLLMLLYRQIDVAALHERAAGVNGYIVFILITVLPLLGFPVSILHAVAGVRFGLGMGFLVVSLSIFLQLLAAHGIVRLAPDFFARKLNALRRRLPNASHRPLTIFTMLLPGAPYSAQIYVLPLVGVPLATYMAWSLPINVARSIAGVAFGEYSDQFTPLSILGFTLYGVAILVTSAWSFQRLRKNLASGPPPPADGLKPPV